MAYVKGPLTPKGVMTPKLRSTDLAGCGELLRVYNETCTGTQSSCCHGKELGCLSQEALPKGYSQEEEGNRKPKEMVFSYPFIHSILSAPYWQGLSGKPAGKSEVRYRESHSITKQSVQDFA